jgi:hypothetical protein
MDNSVQRIMKVRNERVEKKWDRGVAVEVKWDRRCCEEYSLKIRD